MAKVMGIAVDIEGFDDGDTQDAEEIAGFVEDNCQSSDWSPREMRQLAWIIRDLSRQLDIRQAVGNVPFKEIA